MFKLVVLVLAIAASALADSQVVKTGVLGSHVLPAGSAYVQPAGSAYVQPAGSAYVAAAPVAGYSSGYTAGAAVYPQYQQYSQYPYGHYAGYSGYAYPAGYQNLVAPMPYAPVASSGYSAYPSQYLYQQKSLAAAPAHTAYSVL